MKQSTAQDTNTAKSNRWFRSNLPDAQLPELNNLFDLYWGGSERRISKLTLRIIGINVIALIMLMGGVLFLGQYHNKLIEEKLENFTTEISLASAVISEDSIDGNSLNSSKTKNMALRIQQALGHEILIFDQKGSLLISSLDFDPALKKTPIYEQQKPLHSLQILKRMVSFVLKVFPDKKTLPPFPDIMSADAKNHPNVIDALNGQMGIAAWQNDNDQIVLSGAAPIKSDGQIYGALFLIRAGNDIQQDIGEVWINILIAFGATLISTILISIYLSGAIANPLRKLARAAEGLRKGQLTVDDIPNYYKRNDEIGELSSAFRSMAKALWERMDATERFAADVAHELKNPLTSLHSAFETLSVVKKKSDRDKLTNIITHDIQRLDRLITDISHASRLDSKLSRDRLARIDLRNILHNLIDRYKTPLQRENTQTAPQWDENVEFKNVNIKLSSDTSDAIFVWGLHGRLEQVFENLLSNALSFAPKNSVINIHTAEQNGSIIITCEDQGAGIPENKLDAIFERFYTERPGHEGYGKHSGLGLSICKQIITAMGGEIRAENIKNAHKEITGARFIVTLKSLNKTTLHSRGKRS